MFKRVEATNYRLLKSVGQDLAHFNILIGPNASGKSTFFDVLSFIRDFATRDARYAVDMRVESSFDELTHMRQGGAVKFTVEVALPDDVREKSGAEFTRYTVEFAANESRQSNGSSEAIENGTAQVVHESLSLHDRDGSRRTVADRDYLEEEFRKGWHAKLTREFDRNELSEWDVLHVKMRQDVSILSTIVDAANQPAAMFTREYLMEGVQLMMLDTNRITQPVRRAQSTDRLASDGSNFAWVLKRLWDSQDRSSNFGDWLLHVRSVLRNLEDVRPFEYGDRSLGFEVRFSGFAEDKYAPATALSDGTLRFLALTILPYLPQAMQTYLIEEPENGIHPKAIQAIYQSLTSVYDGQVLLATHSPVLLNLAKPSELLCFSRNGDGATEIVSGDRHPNLRTWQGELELSELFAAGVLG